jgi:very-short-patch-repair endonuclease
VRTGSVRLVIAAWLAEVAASHDIRRALAEQVAGKLGQSWTEVLLSLSHLDEARGRKHLENSLPDEKPPGIWWLAKYLLPKSACCAATTDAAFAAYRDCGFNPELGMNMIAALASLLPADELPAILLLPPEDADVDAWLNEASKSLEVFSSSVPRVAVALQIGAADLDRYLKAEPRGTRAKALLTEGTIPVSVMPEHSVRQWARQLSPAVAETLEPVFRDVIANGGNEQTLVLAEELGTAVAESSGDVDTCDRARSAAERFLFERLENHALTAGCFALNKSITCPGGGRPIEIDLCAECWRIAIEIDGFYHFGDPANYRRDRRKDFALQEAGYIVLRWLAEDVAKSLEEILARVRRAMEIQKQRWAKETEQ